GRRRALSTRVGGGGRLPNASRAWSRPIASGRYQTGELHARSWMVGDRNGSSVVPRQQSANPGAAAAACAAQSVANGSTPACLQTRVLQRQLGFSSTRA